MQRADFVAEVGLLGRGDGGGVLDGAVVVAGDMEAYRSEVDKIRQYVSDNYAGCCAGFTAVGENGKMKVEIIIDGETVETFTTERDENGKVIITHNT